MTYMRHHWVDGACLSCGLEETEHEQRGVDGPLPSCPGDLDTVVRGYVKAAIWSTTDEDGRPLDGRFTEDDVDPEDAERIRAEVRDYLELLDREDVPWRDLETEQVGHDLWLTRNRHGAGFWDRGLGVRGETLTRWAHSMGSSDLYAGDDGMLHVT